jgi:hypothetical protein
MSALHQQAGEYASERKYHTTKAALVHDEFFLSER